MDKEKCSCSSTERISNPAERPKQIRVLPELGQELWEKVFTTRQKEGATDSEAARAAWHEVKKYYYKRQDDTLGRWAKKEGKKVVKKLRAALDASEDEFKKLIAESKKLVQ